MVGLDEEMIALEEKEKKIVEELSPIMKELEEVYEPVKAETSKLQRIRRLARHDSDSTLFSDEMTRAVQLHMRHANKSKNI